MRPVRLMAWLLPTAYLAVLLAWTNFHTVDSNRFFRDRTAPFVWSFVAPKLASVGAPLPVATIFWTALGATVAAFFALLWFTIGLRDAAAQSAAEAPGGVSAPAAARAQLRAAVLGERLPSLSAPTCAWLIAAVALLAAWRLGILNGANTGSTAANTFASMDHPFHLARAEALWRSLRDGEVLRWVGNHQGGYPVEFYPLGFEYAVVALRAVLLGMLSVAAAYKLTVILVFVAPAPVYWWMVRCDGRPPVVALSAFVAHVVVAGGIWHGGYSELIYMGLGPNASAALAVLVALVAMTDTVCGGSRRSIAWAALAAGAALSINPRSGIGLIACGVGAWVAAVLSGRTLTAVRRATLRLLAIAALAALVAAPEIGSLLRFGDRYYFIHYTEYASSMQYLSASIDAVAMPVFVLALVGIAATFMLPADRPVTIATVTALIAYAVITLLFSFGGDLPRLVQQLETTRLMPLQRHLTLYIAAVGLHLATRLLPVPRWRPALVERAAALAGPAALCILSFLASGFAPGEVRGPATVERSNVPEMVSLERAIRAAENSSSPDTAILVVGSSLSGHQQLWAPVVSNRVFYYDNWLWYWHTRHIGPYDPRQSSWFEPDRIWEVFSRTYLDDHGIGSVVVTGENEQNAAVWNGFQPLLPGIYASYLVPHPTPIVTFGDRAPDSLTVSNHTIEAASNDAAGDVLIRRTFFPRWHAEVNGRPAPIEQTAGGYMRLQVPHGHATVRLHYAVEPFDWAMRAAALAGLGLVAFLGFVARTGRHPRWRPRNSLPNQDSRPNHVARS